MNKQVVARYPFPIRLGSLLVCVLLAISTTRGPLHGITICAAFGALCLTVAVLSYRIQINATEICIRYAPFLSMRSPVQDVVRLAEGGALILVTSTSRIALRGLSDAARGDVLHILPRRLEFEPSRPGGSNELEISIKKHRRWTIIAGVGFLALGALVIPFFKGNALHGYWDRAGKYLLLLCLLFFIALVFEAGFTWVLWSAKQDIGKIERRNKRRPG
jgi:hypothetical protein